MDRLNKVLALLRKGWDAIPDSVQIIIYVSLSGLLVQFSDDILKYGAEDPYAVIALMGISNVALYYANILRTRE